MALPRNLPSCASFEQNLNAGVLCQFAIRPNNAADGFAGLVVAYNANPQDHFCYLGSITDRVSVLERFEAVALFLRSSIQGIGPSETSISRR